MSEYKFGLVCISTDMQEQGYKFQTMTRKRFLELQERDGRNAALQVLCERIYNNLVVTQKIIEHCGEKKIAAYRLSSDLFPLITDPTLNIDIFALNNYELFQRQFQKIKEAVKRTGVRISTHPDQWNSLASENAGTIEQTIKELNFHGWLLDQCGAERSHWNPINIHVGLSGKDPDGLPAIYKRFIENFEKLDDSVKSRLTIENDDKGLWTCERIITHFGVTRFPLCYDEHHDAVNPSANLSAKDAFELFLSSWVFRHHPQPPLFHYSESIPGATTRLQAHADLPTRLPRQTDLLDGDEIYWDVELKGKDKAIKILQMMAALDGLEKGPHVDID